MMTSSLKKISQATAVAALGVAMVAGVGSAPASAVSLQRFDLTVNFGTTATATGYYTLDTDLLPLGPEDGFGIPLAEWDVKVRDADGNLLDRFYNSYLGNAALNNNLHFAGVFQSQVQYPEALSFTQTVPFKQLTLQFPTAGFTGVATTPIADYISSTSPGISTSVTGGGATSVPEPFTMTATAVAGGMGLWMKRKQKASKAA